MAAPKYESLAHTLAERIRVGAYDAGGVPGERALATEFGLGRVTVRAALRRLDEQGLVQRRGRRGTWALSDKAADARPRLLRADVDRFLDRGRDDRRQVLAFGRVHANAEVADALQLPVGNEVLRVVRLRTRDGMALTYTETFLRLSLAPYITRADLERKPYVQLLEDAGLKIGGAYQSVAAVPAPPLAAGALRIVEGSPVLKLARVLLDEQDTPVQLLLGWYHGEHFEVGMQLSRARDATQVWIQYKPPAAVDAG
jgi:GntR family transcriptional regulator